MLILVKWICYFIYRSQNLNWIIRVYFFDKHIYLDYIKNVKKSWREIYKCAKNRIKYTNVPDFFECMHLC